MDCLPSTVVRRQFDEYGNVALCLPPGGIALIYLVGVALCLVPTMWILTWYGFAVPIVVAWCTVAAYTVYRSRKRAVLGLTLGFLDGLLIVMLVAAASWVPIQMVP